MDHDRAAVARIVAQHWRDAAIKWESPLNAMAHPCALILAALDGETDPDQLGISPDHADGQAIRRIVTGPWQDFLLTHPQTRYRKKGTPAEVEAVQLRWTQWSEVCELLGGIVSEDNPGRYSNTPSDTCGEIGPYIELTIPTPDGERVVYHGEWIVKSIEGEFSKCEPEAFVTTYEPISLHKTGRVMVDQRDLRVLLAALDTADAVEWGGESTFDRMAEIAQFKPLPAVEDDE